MKPEQLKQALEHASNQHHIPTDGFIAQLTRKHIETIITTTPGTMPYPAQAHWELHNVPWTHVEQQCDMWQTVGTDTEGRKWKGNTSLLIAHLRQLQLLNNPTAPCTTVTYC